MQNESFESLNKKSDKELLEFLSQGGATVGSQIQGIQERDREIVKAILAYRSVKVMQRHNSIMIFFTIVITILTFLLVYKEFFAQG